MSDTENAVRALLLPADDVKAVLEVVLADENATAPVLGDQGDPGTSNDQRLLAVVSHAAAGSAGHGEGSVFLLRRTSSNPEQLEIHRVLQIFRDFSISLSQSRRATLDLSANAKPVSNQPRAGFVLTIKPGNNIAPLILITYDTQNLRPLLSECKRLQDIAPTHSTDQSSNSQSWILPYTLSKNTLPIISQTPPDLRLVNKPLHTRLSPASAGLPGDDAADIMLIRDHWLRTRARDACQKGTFDLALRLGTFNVNGKLPLEDLSAWVRGKTTYTPSAPALPPLGKVSPLSIGVLEAPSQKNDVLSNVKTAPSATNISTDLDRDPDILVLGFQELDLSTEALIYSTSTVKEDAWCAAIFASLGEKGAQYIKLASKQLVGMLIIIVVKKELKSCFSDIRVCAAGAGIMGIMGNKGGTAIRLKFTPTSTDESGTAGRYRPTVMTFVNTHLAAFDEMVDKRNMDFHDLSKRLAFSPSAPVNTVNPLPQISIYESDVLFWMGDLNYRIDLPDRDVRAILKSWPEDVRYTSLLKYDQLRNAIAARKAFTIFREYPINHPPSYRFGSGMLTDEFGYDMKRRPAWTDRILHLSSPSVPVKQLNYNVHPDITFSDHRPVSAEFIVPIDLLPEKIHDMALSNLLRQVSNLSEEGERPIVNVDGLSIDLGQIRYMHHVSQTISVKNTGKVPCTWRFIPVEPDEAISPEWLHISSLAGLLLPEEVATISLEVHINNEEAAKLNLGPKDLSLALILHTALGKDHFISITAEYQYTCFAQDLTRLTRLPGPVRSLKSSDNLLPENRAVNAPREVMRLVNWLMKTVDINTLLNASSNLQIVDQLRECLDTGADFPYPVGKDDPKISRAFWDTLWDLLMSLPEPVVPFSLQARCVQMTSRDEAFEFLDELTPAAVNVWISITAFLQFVCQSEPTVASRVATMCFPALLPDDPSPLSAPISPLGKVNFLLYFIS